MKSMTGSDAEVGSEGAHSWMTSPCSPFSKAVLSGTSPYLPKHSVFHIDFIRTQGLVLFNF